MNAKIETLRAKDANNEEYLVYPRTLINCVIDESGTNIEDRLVDYIENNFDDVFATAKDVNDIKDGTTQVENAKTLDGHEAEYFAPQTTLDAVQSAKNKNLSTVGWYRIAKREEDYPSTCLIKIGNVFGNGGSDEHLLLYTSSYDNDGFSTLSSRSLSYNIFSKIRKVKEGSVVYIEVYYACPANNPCSFAVLDFAYNKRNPWLVIEPVATQETVEGVTVVATYNIPANATPATNTDLANYLPNTGGELKANTSHVLQITNTGGNNNIPIYKGLSGILGYLGFTGENKPVYCSKTGNPYDLLHTGNFSNYAAEVEEGTFTLTHVQSGVTFSGYKYLKTGKIVIIYGNKSASGDMSCVAGDSFSGLPFPIASGCQHYILTLTTDTKPAPISKTDNYVDYYSGSNFFVKSSFSRTKMSPLFIFGLYLTND